MSDSANELSPDAKERLTLVIHELRAPLTVIRGYMQLLDRPLDDLERVEAGESAARASDRLEVLLDDLMAAVSGPAVFAPAMIAAVDIKALAEESASDIDPLISQSIEVSGDACVVAGDTTRLRQVMDNLLSNAVKHTPDDGLITIEICDELADAGIVRVSVEDSGPGIAQADRERVFDLFERLGAEHRHTEGLGLGLPIARAIVEGHGGTLTLADPVRDGGARFVADLPAYK